jgi:drug/metabolite transporter (DMT)-like permease
MVNKSTFYFEANKLWVEKETWTDLIANESPAAVCSVKAAAVEIIQHGTAFTIMFTVLPKLGVVGNSAIMNVEPVFALVLAWAILGQSIAPVQVAGALLVVATVVWLGLRRR